MGEALDRPRYRIDDAGHLLTERKKVDTAVRMLLEDGLKEVEKGVSVFIAIAVLRRWRSLFHASRNLTSFQPNKTSIDFICSLARSTMSVVNWDGSKAMQCLFPFN